MRGALGRGWGLKGERVEVSVGERERVSRIDGGVSGPFRTEVLESIGGHAIWVGNDLFGVLIVNRVQVRACVVRVCRGLSGDRGVMSLPNFLVTLFRRGVQRLDEASTFAARS